MRRTEHVSPSQRPPVSDGECRGEEAVGVATNPFRPKTNQPLQATPGLAFLFLLAQRPGAPELCVGPMTQSPIPLRNRLSRFPWVFRLMVHPPLRVLAQ